METYKDNMSYEQLILYHLRDISRLSVIIQGEAVNPVAGVNIGG
jgi:hypothetical protein